MSRGVRLCAAGGLCLCLTAGCSGLIGPDYVRPDLTMPAEWKNAGRAWSGARPADDAPKRDWWEVYGDAELSELQRRARTDNFSLQIAVARLDQARAQAGMRAAALLPSLQAGVTASRTRISAERPRTNYSTQNFSTVQTDLRPVLAVAYEFDWLGKIRRDLEGAQAGAEQALAERENVALLVSAQLAATYFQLRQSDEEIALLGRTLAAQEKVRELTARRHELGAASAADLAQQGALTESTRAQLDLLRMRRKHLENALATLTGTPAAQFSLPPGNLPAAPAAVPLAAPGTLLERRP
ncbi:MAG: TolC family protein, partial [Rhodocyclaceae bacterium]|nr:TolC family protein [Rhodocyclaceae bacterium]